MRSDCGNGTRSVGASGLAFVVCFAAAAALYGGGAGSTQASVAAYYAYHGDRQIGGLAVLLAGCVCLLVYVTGRTPSALGRASGVAATVVLAADNALWAATAFAVDLEPGYVPSASSHLLLEDAAWIVIVTAAGLAAAYWYVPLALFLVWIVADCITPAPPSRHGPAPAA